MQDLPCPSRLEGWVTDRQDRGLPSPVRCCGCFSAFCIEFDETFRLCWMSANALFHQRLPNLPYLSVARALLLPRAALELSRPSPGPIPHGKMVVATGGLIAYNALQSKRKWVRILPIASSGRSTLDRSRTGNQISIGHGLPCWRPAVQVRRANGRDPSLRPRWSARTPALDNPSSWHIRGLCSLIWEKQVKLLK
jgi:hypothetical protein